MNTKRILALIMSLVMCFSLVPATSLTALAVKQEVVATPGDWKPSTTSNSATIVAAHLDDRDTPNVDEAYETSCGISFNVTSKEATYGAEYQSASKGDLKDAKLYEVTMTSNQPIPLHRADDTVNFAQNDPYAYWVGIGFVAPEKANGLNVGFLDGANGHPATTGDLGQPTAEGDGLQTIGQASLGEITREITRDGDKGFAEYFDTLSYRDLWYVLQWQHETSPSDLYILHVTNKINADIGKPTSEDISDIDVQPKMYGDEEKDGYYGKYYTLTGKLYDTPNSGSGEATYELEFPLPTTEESVWDPMSVTYGVGKTDSDAKEATTSHTAKEGKNGGAVIEVTKGDLEASGDLYTCNIAIQWSKELLLRYELVLDVMEATPAQLTVDSPENVTPGELQAGVEGVTLLTSAGKFDAAVLAKSGAVMVSGASEGKGVTAGDVQVVENQKITFTLKGDASPGDTLKIDVTDGAIKGVTDTTPAELEVTSGSIGNVEPGPEPEPGDAVVTAVILTLAGEDTKVGGGKPDATVSSITVKTGGSEENLTPTDSTFGSIVQSVTTTWNSDDDQPFETVKGNEATIGITIAEGYSWSEASTEITVDGTSAEPTFNGQTATVNVKNVTVSKGTPTITGDDLMGTSSPYTLTLVAGEDASSAEITVKTDGTVSATSGNAAYVTAKVDGGTDSSTVTITGVQATDGEIEVLIAAPATENYDAVSGAVKVRVVGAGVVGSVSITLSEATVEIQGGTAELPEPVCVVIPPDSADVTFKWTTEATSGTLDPEAVTATGVYTAEFTVEATEGYALKGTQYYINGVPTTLNGNASKGDLAATVSVTVRMPEKTVTFDANGGSFAEASTAEVKTDIHGKVNAPVTNPTRPGYEFAGWFDTDATSGGTAFSNQTVYTDNATLYARWTAKSYSINVTVRPDPAAGQVRVTVGGRDATTANIGDTVKLTLTPGNGYKAPATISVYGESKYVSLNECEFVMRAEDTNITVTFVRKATIESVAVEATSAYLDATISSLEGTEGKVTISGTILDEAFEGNNCPIILTFTDSNDATYEVTDVTLSRSEPDGGTITFSPTKVSVIIDGVTYEFTLIPGEIDIYKMTVEAEVDVPTDSASVGEILGESTDQQNALADLGLDATAEAALEERIANEVAGALTKIKGNGEFTKKIAETIERDTKVGEYLTQVATEYVGKDYDGKEVASVDVKIGLTFEPVKYIPSNTGAAQAVTPVFMLNITPKVTITALDATGEIVDTDEDSITEFADPLEITVPLPESFVETTDDAKSVQLWHSHGIPKIRELLPCTVEGTGGDCTATFKTSQFSDFEFTVEKTELAVTYDGLDTTENYTLASVKAGNHTFPRPKYDGDATVSELGWSLTEKDSSSYTSGDIDFEADATIGEADFNTMLAKAKADGGTTLTLYPVIILEEDGGNAGEGEQEKPNTGSPVSGSPSSGSPSSSSSTVSDAKTDESGKTTTVEVTATATTTGSKTTAFVTSTNMDKAVASAVAEAAKKETAPVVEVEVKTGATATSLEVTLPTSSLKTLAEADNSSLVIVSDIAEVAIDNTALAALVDQATGSTIVLQVEPVAEDDLTETQQEALAEAEDTAIMDLSLVSNGVAIHDYNGGKFTITLPYELPEGSEAKAVRVYYLDDEGALERCPASYADGKVTFTTTHLSKYIISSTPLTDENPFIDVAEDDWWYDAVLWAAENGITAGTNKEGTTFEPTKTCTRAQIVSFLYRYYGSPEVTPTTKFTDVPADAYYADAVAWAVANNITAGKTDTIFDPNGDCTRAQAMAFLHRAEGSPAAGDSASKFSDVASDAYYVGAVAWAVDQSITAGTSSEGTTFSPSKACNRAEIVSFLYRLSQIG